MAIVLTGISAIFRRVPFIKPPDLARQFTPIPRARVDFINNNVVIPLKPVNDQQNFQIACNVPTTFAYRLLSSLIKVRQDQADNWDAVGQLQITNGMRGQTLGQVSTHPIVSELTNSFSTILPERLYFTAPDRAAPTYIIQSLSRDVAPVIDFRLSNNDVTAAAAGVLQFFASFYEYDIEQVEMFPALIPTLTYALA